MSNPSDEFCEHDFYQGIDCLICNPGRFTPPGEACRTCGGVDGEHGKLCPEQHDGECEHEWQRKVPKHPDNLAKVWVTESTLFGWTNPYLVSRELATILIKRNKPTYLVWQPDIILPPPVPGAQSMEITAYYLPDEPQVGDVVRIEFVGEFVRYARIKAIDDEGVRFVGIPDKEEPEGKIEA